MTGQEEWQNFKINLVDADFTLKLMNWASGVGRPVQGEKDRTKLWRWEDNS